MLLNSEHRISTAKEKKKRVRQASVSMASKQMLAAVAASMALVFLPTLASATDHVVGVGDVGFDYAAWAESKQFTVGDTLGTRSWIHQKPYTTCDVHMHIGLAL